MAQLVHHWLAQTQAAADVDNQDEVVKMSQRRRYDECQDEQPGPVRAHGLMPQSSVSRWIRVPSRVRPGEDPRVDKEEKTAWRGWVVSGLVSAPHPGAVPMKCEPPTR